MTKHEELARKNPGITSIGAAAAAMAPDTAVERGISTSLIEQDDIALLAYSYWEARGCLHGSPEEDWFRAEKELRQRAAAAA
jgi:hypothetical protein